MKFLLGALFTVFVAIVSVFAIVTSGVVNVGADQEHSPIVFSFWKPLAIVPQMPVKILWYQTQRRSISALGARTIKICVQVVTYLREWTKRALAKAYIQSHLTSLRLDRQTLSNSGRCKTKLLGNQTRNYGFGNACMGASHDDARMWAMVAFIRSLPKLDEAQYTMLTTRIDGDMMDMSFDGDMNMSDDGSGMQH